MKFMYNEQFPKVDDPHREASTIVEIMVEDVNDNVPEFEHDVYAISIMENLPAGFSVVQVVARDVDKVIYNNISIF